MQYTVDLLPSTVPSYSITLSTGNGGGLNRDPSLEQAKGMIFSRWIFFLAQT